MSAGRLILAGSAAGPVLSAAEGLSFWGGVDPATGRVIDVHHPLHGVTITGGILMMPSSRGSCTAIEIAKCGMPWRKLLVPSSGSMIQRGLFGSPSIVPPSSSTKPQSGRAASNSS